MGALSPFVLAATGEAGFQLIPALILIPGAGALLVVLIPRSRVGLHQQVAVLFSAISGALSVWVLVEFVTADAGFQFVSQFQWVEDLGISWHAGIDGISLFLVVLTGLLFPIAMLAVDPGHDHKPYFAWLLVLQAGCMGAFVALDLFMFFVFFEIVLVPMYFLIGKWGHGNAVYAATKFFIYTMLGSALMLVSIVALAVLQARDSGSPITFDLIEIADNLAVSTNTGRVLFLGFAVAFAIKVPLFPVHTWLPDAHTEAPTAGSVILAGVMLKLGTYGFLRFGLYLFPEAAHYFAPLFLTLGVIGIIYGAVVATMQQDLKRLVAYSSIAHLGFIIVGTFALNTQGLQGGLAQMVNHGLSTGALFLLVGWLYDRRHTRQISELGGLQRTAPVFAGVFTLVMLSSIGLPGLNGFVGEFLILVGAFTANRWWAVVATAGVVLAALYLLWAYQRVFHGSADGDNADMKDMTPWEGLVLAPILVGIVFLGVYPKPMLDRMEPAIDRLVAHVEASVDDFDEPTPTVVTRGSFAELLRSTHEADDDHGEGEG
jgi:NADH-quinone oxidoreductase subunit M